MTRVPPVWSGPRRGEPSLLRALLHDHLDPGYRAAAEASSRDRAGASSRTGPVWLVVGCLVVGLVLAVAFVDTRDQSGSRADDHHDILATVRDAEDRNDTLTRELTGISSEVDARRTEVFAGNDEAQSILTRMRDAESAAAAVPVHGPGLTVVVGDPPGARDDLGGSAGSPRGGSVVLDRDLQSVVNALWAGGAEAVAVGGVRIGPTATVRSAGGAMLVDNQPVFSPYRVTAVGDPRALETSFVVSDTYLRLSFVKQMYGMEFQVVDETDAALPAAAVRVERGGPEGGAPR